MAQTSEYKILQGNGRDIETKLSVLAKDGWKPIMMSTILGSGPMAQVLVTVILEHVLGA